MRTAPLCALALVLACLAPLSAGFDWRSRLTAAEAGAQQPPGAGHQQQQPLVLLLRELEGEHPCNKTSDCGNEDISLCDEATHTCECSNSAYWQREADACVKKAELGQNCSHADMGSCRPEHSSCQLMRNGAYKCACNYQYYPNDDGNACVHLSSPFFTTTIIVSVCILFAAVALGVVMQIRSNMQRRLYERQYHHHANLDAMLAAQRRARQRRAARQRANPSRRYSEEAEPDEPPPPYVPIFTTRASGDWGKLPSYQEAVGGSEERNNEAFEMEECVFTADEEQRPAVAETPLVEAGSASVRTEAASGDAGAVPSVAVLPVDQSQPAGVTEIAGATGVGGEVVTETAASPHLPPPTDRDTQSESPLRRTGSL